MIRTLSWLLLVVFALRGIPAEWHSPSDPCAGLAFAVWHLVLLVAVMAAALKAAS